MNGAGSSTGPDLIPVSERRRESLVSDNRRRGRLPLGTRLKAPRRALTNEPFTVKVTRVLPDGSKEPAEGVNGRRES